jgi:sRNA-binding regulator protein Hfq
MRGLAYKNKIRIWIWEEKRLAEEGNELGRPQNLRTLFSLVRKNRVTLTILVNGVTQGVALVHISRIVASHQSIPVVYKHANVIMPGQPIQMSRPGDEAGLDEAMR